MFKLINYFSKFSRNSVTGFSRHHSVKRVTNLILNTIEKKVKRTSLVSYPYKILIDPTNICMLKCPLCPTGQGLNGRKKGKMAFNDFKKIIDQAADYAYTLELYSWGEPLLNEDIFDMIAYAEKEKLLSVSFSTNFQHFPEGFAERLVSSGLEQLIISLDGATQETYEKYRVGGDFNKAIENIKKIVSAKRRLNSSSPFIEVRFIVMKHNEHEIRKIRTIADQLGVDRLEIVPVMINIKNDSEVNKWLPEDELLSCYDYKRKTKKALSRSCSWLWNSLAIGWDGSVAPCCHLFHESLDYGNILKENLKVIWNNDSYLRSRKLLKTNQIEKEQPITACEMCLKPYLFAQEKGEIDFINESFTNKLSLT